MEFWGVEVKPAESVKVDPGTDKYLHLSQASLGETKKGTESVALNVKFNDQKIVLGTLSGEKFPQIQFDLVFEKEFELSNSSKHTSIYVCGYRTPGDVADEFDESDDDESEEEAIPLDQVANGKVEVKTQQAKPTNVKPTTPKSDASTAKPKPKAEESKKDVKPKVENAEEDDSDDDDEEFDLDDDSDEMGDGDSSDEDDDDSDEDEDEETPAKAKSGDKRSAPAKKTPVPEKKAKLLSPAASQKSGDGGKKGAHTATPHPAKQAGKTDKSKQQSPKSGGSIVCKSCSRTFNSDKSMQDHAKAKHGASK